MNQDVVESVTPMSDYQHPRQWAHDAILVHRSKNRSQVNCGSVIGESFVHQVYVPSRLWALVNSKIIKPEVKLAEILYPVK